MNERVRCLHCQPDRFSRFIQHPMTAAIPGSGALLVALVVGLLTDNTVARIAVVAVGFAVGFPACLAAHDWNLRRARESWDVAHPV